MFSPYYRRARGRGAGDPLAHCALNVALYGASGPGWALTERPPQAVRRSATELVLGPSSLRWEGDVLRIEIDEVTVPWPRRLRGTVRVEPLFFGQRRLALDPTGTHRWWPVAPLAQVTVELTRPDLRWSGRGYLDSNEGDAALEDGFTNWDWSRAETGDGTTILYDAHWRGGGGRTIALTCHPTRGIEEITPPPPVRLSPTRWRLPRTTRSEAPEAVRIAASWEDGPFYARSLLATHLLGAPAMGVHESLSLDRFVQPVVQLMIPFRMPRAWR